MSNNGKVGTRDVDSTHAPLTNQPVEEVDMAPSHSKRSPAFQFYPAEFLASRKVDRMSMTERGIYITLLCQCWLDNGLPTDLDELADAVRMKPAQFKRLWENSKLRLCFQERGGKLHHDRLDVERKKQVEYRRRQADAANKRWDTHGNATALPPHKQSDALISSHLNSSDLNSTRPIIRRRRMDAAMEHESGIYLPQRAFDDFSALHPGEDLAAWFESVCSAWAGRNTGADMFRFWKARHDEKWPPEMPVASRPKPAWAVSK